MFYVTVIDTFTIFSLKNKKNSLAEHLLLLY